jgi:hypothetical protein
MHFFRDVVDCRQYHNADGFNQPILGTYELVGFLTAAVWLWPWPTVLFKMAISPVSFILERFPTKIQTSVEIIVNAASLLFWAGAVGR